MTRSPVRRAVFFFVFALSIPVLTTGCPKKPVPVEDAGEAPPASSPSVTQLAPLTDDGGEDAAAEASAHHGYGPPVNPNQQRIKACCNALRGTHDPMLMSVAAQCDMLAAQVGPSGSDPAFAQLRAILKSQKLPAACSGM
jgi:hypothetical protein